MEKRHGQDFKVPVLISECIGTMILSSVVCTVWTYPNLSVTLWQVILITATALYVVYIIFAPISGGHFNPIVTLGVYISITLNAANLVLLVLIVLAQTFGAFLGILLSRALRIKTSPTETYPYYPQSPYFEAPIEVVYYIQTGNLAGTEGQVFATDMICSFIFVLVVLITFHQSIKQQSMGNARENCITGIPIAGTYMACLALSAQTSLNILNPALASAIIMEPIIFGDSYSPPLVALQSGTLANKALSPFVGALVAALVFLGQKSIIDSRYINYSKDFVRGSIRLDLNASQDKIKNK